MQPDTSKIWTLAELRTSIAKILVESLGVDEVVLTESASLVHDLGAESIDFLDISFKCQQTFGVDLPARLIQDRVVDWRDLSILARVLDKTYGLTVSAEELRTIAPATAPAVLEHVHAHHGLPRAEGENDALAHALAAQLLVELDGMGLDLTDVPLQTLARPLIDNLHSPVVMDEIMKRFTVRALGDYIAAQLAAASRLTSGT